MNLTAAIRIAAASVALIVSAAWAGDACCPEDANGATTAQMPATLPEGHPPIGGGAMSAGMPAGHPPIDGMPAGHPPLADQAPALGTLIVKAMQGTKDAPPIAGQDVSVEVYHRGRLLTTLTGTLDDKGNATFENVKIPGSAQPVVRLEYGGVAYQGVGQMLTAQNPDQIVRVTAYEVTETAPAWRIAMRHVMLHPAADGMHVVEVLAVENPTDRTWRGAGGVKSADGHDNGGPTVTFQLPAGAADVQLGEGFHACCTNIADARITHAMPLLPGVTKFQFSYTLAPADGGVAMALGADAPTARLSVFVPDDGTMVQVEGLDAGQTLDAGHGRMRFYFGQNIAPDQTVSVNVTGRPADATPTDGAPSSPRGAKAIAGIGIVAMLTAAGVVVLRKPRKPREETGK